MRLKADEFVRHVAVGEGLSQARLVRLDPAELPIHYALGRRVAWLAECVDG